MARKDVKVRRASPYSLVYSTSSDRSAPRALHQAQDLTGAIYVFVSPTTDVDSVKFYADETTGALTATDSVAPFDLAGGNATLLPADFAAGDHTITAMVVAGGNAYELTATFSVLPAVRPAIVAVAATVEAPTISTAVAAANVTAAPSAVAAVTAAATLTVTTSSSGNPNLKGEVSTAEAGLVADPDVLWVGNYGSGESNYRTLWGTTGDTWASNQSIADYSGVVGSGKGLTFRGKTVAYKSNGYGRYHYFDLAGLNGGYDELYLRYRVFFPNDYPWINSAGGGGGKLPGFAGKVGTTYRTKIPSGGTRYRAGNVVCSTSNYLTADSFSARLLWLKDRRLNTYMYVPDAAHKGSASSSSYFGWSTSAKTAIGSNSNFTFTAGQWVTIEQRAKMNTVGLSNGIFELWVDDVKRLSVTNLIWRTSSNPTLNLTCVYDSWFYGGPQATYDANGNLISLGDAPETDAYIYLDDWAISTAPIGV